MNSLEVPNHANTTPEKLERILGQGVHSVDESTPKLDEEATRTSLQLSLQTASSLSVIPYALTWTKQDSKVKPRRTLLKGARPDSSETIEKIISLEDFSCSAIPDSEGEFIMFGGRLESDTDSNDVTHLSMRDMSVVSLETTGTIPSPRNGHGAVIIGRVLVVFGGYLATDYLHFLNLDTWEWSSLRPPEPYPSGRHGHSFTAVEGRVWMYGGFCKGVPLDELWCLDLTVDNICWRQIPKRDPWPEAIGYHRATLYEGDIYIIGGETYDKVFVDTMWKLDLQTTNWKKVLCSGRMPTPRESHCTAVIGDKLFLYGGLTIESRSVDGTVTCKTMDDAFVFNFRNKTWRSLGMRGDAPPFARGGACLPLGSRLAVIGGTYSTVPSIYLAEVVDGSKMTLPFMTETSQLKFTPRVMDLTQFVQKEGRSAYSAGFSDVWKGEMSETKEPIAIKVLRVAGPGDTNGLGTGRLRTRFSRELNIWTRCQHERVLELKGYAYIEDVPCLISPWCSNGNILDYLSKNPRADRRKLLIQVAEGLTYLHRRIPPIVHADIKPANVLIGDEGDAKLCDFGISTLLQDLPTGLTTTTSVKGTLRYSSPEMLGQDGKTILASDVWAFGMLTLNVMTSKIPYHTCVSDGKVVLNIVTGVLPAEEDYSELPTADPLWDVMKGCWKMEPDARPEMADVVRDLSSKSPAIDSSPAKSIKDMANKQENLDTVLREEAMMGSCTTNSLNDTSLNIGALNIQIVLLVLVMVGFVYMGIPDIV